MLKTLTALGRNKILYCSLLHRSVAKAAPQNAQSFIEGVGGVVHVVHDGQ